MPTNYQARVKMTPKPQIGHASRDEQPVSSKLRMDSAATPASGSQVRVSAKFQRSPVAEIKNVLRPTALKRPPAGRLYLGLKRAADLLFGSVLLLIAMPIILIAALAIRIDTPGSPFFFQTRLGKNGKPFRIFKLRGMYIDAPIQFPTFYDYSHKQDLEFCFHHEEDPRVTRAGKFIRKTSIDELPNLWNVVMGDMALVGPRPEIPNVLALYGPYRNEYLSVKPGITCLSKCTGRDRLTKKETIEFDLDYIRRRSMTLDIGILWRTMQGVVLRRDVF